MVLFFGDHQPALKALRSKVEVKPEYLVKGGEKELYNYIVPYYIWTNTGKSLSEIPEYISPNYLSLILKKLAGMPYDNWDRLREQAQKAYPVLSLQYVSRDGKSFQSAHDKSVGTEEVMKDYRMVQYDRLFG